jgi:UDP:flavonoid glycosyltransferase YjiC (YdhE family)
MSMRVLFTTWAWPSHYFPMVPLAWALRSAGHDVLMTSQPDLLPTMRASGLPHTAVGRDYDVTADHGVSDETTVEPAPARPSRSRPPAGEVAGGLLGDLAAARLAHGSATTEAIDAEARAMFETIWAVRSANRRSGLAVYGPVAEAMVDGLLAQARAWRPDLVVYDPLTHAGPVVARLLGVPAVRHLFGPDITSYLTARGGAGLGPMLDRLGLDDVDLVGTATVDACPPGLRIDAATRRLAMRYVPYNGPSEVPSWLLEPPDHPRICLTWGTSTDRLAGRRAFLPDEVVLACTKLADDRDAELVLAITPRQRDLVPDLPAGIRVVESVPLDALLPTCRAVIHQGGAGTMLTAVRHGVPQIIVAQLVDQAANACRVVAAGAGRTRAAADLTAAALLGLGHDLLDLPGYAAAARTLRRQMLDQPAPADLVTDLEALI